MVPASMAGQKARCTCGRSISIPPASGAPSRGPAARPSLQALKAARWYVSERGLSSGPFSFRQMREKVLRGELEPDRLVYAAPLGEWRRLRAVPELQPGFRPEREALEQWYVSVRGKRYGPYSAERMLELIRQGRLTARSLVWSRELKDWRPLGRLARFASALSAVRGDSDVEEMWYYVRDGERVGPLSFEQMLSAAREGGIRGSDRVWSNRLGGWLYAEAVPELASAIAAAPESAARLWYYRRRRLSSRGTATLGEVEGPVSFSELSRLVESGQVTAGDTVFHKGLGAWKDIRDVPELQRAIAAAVSGLGRADAAAEQWYFRRTGPRAAGGGGSRERGPVTERLIAEMLTAGRLKPDDLLWGPGFERWRPVREVPQFARYLPAEALASAAPADAEPTDLATTEVEGQPDAVERTQADRRLKFALAAVAVVLLTLAAGLVLSRRGGAPEGRPGGARGRFEPPTDPVRFVRKWLELFLSGSDASPGAQPPGARLREERLGLFYREGYMDACAGDIRAALRGVPVAELGVQEEQREVLRAEDGDGFCYCVPFAGAALSVRRLVPGPAGPQELTGAFRREEFERVRCFRITAPPGTAAPDATVLVATDVGAAGERRHWIVAFGRVGYVGAAAGRMRVRYVTGYKGKTTSEADCLLLLGVEEQPGLGGTEWGRFGELMSVDASLVPAAVLKRRERLSSPPGKRLLVSIQGGVTRASLVQRYGPPQRTQTIELPAGEVLMVPAVPGTALPVYPRLEACCYGSFGVVFEPAGEEAVGYLFGALPAGGP